MAETPNFVCSLCGAQSAIGPDGMAHCSQHRGDILALGVWLSRDVDPFAPRVQTVYTDGDFMMWPHPPRAICECGHAGREHSRRQWVPAPVPVCACGCTGFHEASDAAPAAPSVGEPELDWETHLGLAAANLYVSGDVEPDALESYERLNALHDRAIARIAALRSSLEEARKDSERLKASVAGLARFECGTGGCGNPDCCGTYGEMQSDATGEYVRYEDVMALFPPRAPSPRDEP